MSKIETHAFHYDERNNICLEFGNHFIGIKAGRSYDTEGKLPDVGYVQFEELQKPFFEGDKEEDYKPRTDMSSIILYFPTVESVDAVIRALQDAKRHIKPASD